MAEETGERNRRRALVVLLAAAVGVVVVVTVAIINDRTSPVDQVAPRGADETILNPRPKDPDASPRPDPGSPTDPDREGTGNGGGLDPEARHDDDHVGRSPRGPDAPGEPNDGEASMPPGNNPQNRPDATPRPQPSEPAPSDSAPEGGASQEPPAPSPEPPSTPQPPEPSPQPPEPSPPTSSSPTPTDDPTAEPEPLPSFRAAVAPGGVDYGFVPERDGRYTFVYSYEIGDVDPRDMVARQTLVVVDRRLQPNAEGATQGADGRISARVLPDEFAADGVDSPELIPDRDERGAMRVGGVRVSDGVTYPLRLDQPSDTALVGPSSPTPTPQPAPTDDDEAFRGSPTPTASAYQAPSATSPGPATPTPEPTP
ncbi:hypothetical protein [Naumannella huperziae]